MPFYDESNFFPGTSIGYLLRVCHQHSFAALDRLFAAEGLRAVQWSALISIHFQRGSTCATLARDLAHDKGAMTRIIDGLEQRGLVERRRDDADRRVVNLSLTPAGTAMTMRGRELAIGCWNELLADWPEDDVASLIAQLSRLHATMEARTCAA